jgi:uncharacterized repeat protein (TIGR01451 family)
LTAVVGAPISYQINVTNPSPAPLAGVSLTAQFDEGLDHESRARTVTLQVGNLAPQETKNFTLVLTGTKAGRFRTQVVASAGTLTDQAVHEVTITMPQMSLQIDGPKTRYKDRPADWAIRVGNPSDTPLNNVVVRDKLPAELAFVGASDGGRFEGGEVVWNLGALRPREEKVLQLTARGIALSKAAVQTVTVTADPGIRKDAQAALEIFGAPALSTRLVDEGDPAEIGKKVVYKFEIVNAGTLPATDIEVRFQVPAEMKLTDAKGPAQPPNVQGPLVVFPKLTLDPGKAINYLVEVEAVRAGDVRFRAEVLSPSLEAGPRVDEQSTRIFDPRVPPNGNPPLPPPPPPPGT